MSSSIDIFKTKFSYGARANLFEVTIVFPFGGDTEKFKFTCKGASLPASRTIGTEQINFQGDMIVIAKDKDSAPDPITLTNYVDEDFAVTNAFQLWLETIQQDNTGFRTTPQLYKTDQLFVTQWDHLKQPIRQVQFIGSFPTTVAENTLDWGGGAVHESSITLAYDYWKLIPVSG